MQALARHRADGLVNMYDFQMQSIATDLTAFILAGGKSSRMGSDKAFLEFEGRTLLARTVELAESVAPHVYIVGSREKFGEFGPVVEDAFRDCGPLAGIHAALHRSQTDLNLMLAVDMPFVPRMFLQYLLRESREMRDAMVIVPRAEGRRQTLCAIYRRDFADPAETALRGGRNRIDILFKTVPVRVIEEDELQRAGFSPAIFRNLNTPADLETARLPADEGVHP
ncbi:MAG: molybdenum cofactor guanylyltransferase [Candidatus Sulfotelmatobacter sp.]